MGRLCRDLSRQCDFTNHPSFRLRFDLAAVPQVRRPISAANLGKHVSHASPNHPKKWRLSLVIAFMRQAGQPAKKGVRSILVIPDLQATIIPGKSAAGLEIGSFLGDLLSHAHFVTATPASDLLRHEFGPVKVWALHGIISQIGVYEGYEGKLEGVGIGSTIADLEDQCHWRLLEDEEDNLVVDGKPGLAFETTAWGGDHRITNNRDAKVIAIFVY